MVAVAPPVRPPLSLAREVCDEDGARGGKLAPLVDASRRQFALLLTALAKEPLAPAELVQPTSVGGF